MLPENQYLIDACNKLIELKYAKSLAEVAKTCGKTSQYFTDLKKGKSVYSRNFLESLLVKYPLNLEYILSGKGEVLRPNINPKEYSSHIKVKVVTVSARAGYSESYYSEQYLNDMPTVLIDADQEYKGNYLAFEVDGDSMEPDYLSGDIVICREVKRDLWQYKLHFKDWDFVIAHGTKGIMLKEIIDHNTETGDIICHSINQEEGRNADFTLNLREVSFLYNVVEHRRSGRNKRRNR